MSNLSGLRVEIPESIFALTTQASASTAQCRIIQGKFLRGPVPLDWLQQAACLPGRALHVGVALWFLDGFEQAGTVQARPSVLREFGMDRHASYRALRQLENAGLVSVLRMRGAAPMVTLLIGRNS